jgi:adenine phosphoribosyltransferase
VDSTAAAELIASHVVDVPDFPQSGIVFKDLSPLFADGPAFHQTIDAIAEVPVDPDGEPGDRGYDLVAGIEARGFLLAAGVAYATGAGVVPVRKAGKLPRATHAATYDLEYGTATLEIHTDALRPGQRVLVVDDVLATGGTAQATVSLIERTGARVIGLTVLLELAFLAGRDRLAGCPVRALLTV